MIISAIAYSTARSALTERSSVKPSIKKQLNRINYTISTLKKQITRLEIKKQYLANDDNLIKIEKDFFIDKVENFCYGPCDAIEDDYCEAIFCTSL